jgi:hypothetical protein
VIQFFNSIPNGFVPLVKSFKIRINVKCLVNLVIKFSFIFIIYNFFPKVRNSLKLVFKGDMLISNLELCSRWSHNSRGKNSNRIFETKIGFSFPAYDDRVYLGIGRV